VPWFEVLQKGTDQVFVTKPVELHNDDLVVEIQGGLEIQVNIFCFVIMVFICDKIELLKTTGDFVGINCIHFVMKTISTQSELFTFVQNFKSSLCLRFKNVKNSKMFRRIVLKTRNFFDFL
jgi:hypothetical protein